MQRNSKIVALIEESKGLGDGPSAAILKIYNQIKKEAVADKLWYVRSFSPKQVGVHLMNRGKYMVSGPASHEIGDKVDGVGFDADMLRDATAFEEPENRANEAAFLKLVEMDEHLARFRKGDIEVSSVACSHYNQFLAAAIDGVPSSYDNLSLSGRLNKDVLMNRYPEMEFIFTKGMSWTVWKRDAEQLYPDLPDIAQRALNAKYAAQQREHGFHHFQRAGEIILSDAAKASGDRAKFAIRDLLQTRPEHPEVIPSIVDCAIQWGGDPKGSHIADLMRFVRAFMPAGRTLPASMWKSIAALKLEPEYYCPHVIFSVLMLLAGSPAKTAPSNVAKIVSAGEVGGLAKSPKKEQMKECEGIIVTAIQTAKRLDLTAKAETKLLGDFRSNLMVKLFGKSDTVKGKSFVDIAAEFFQQAVAEKRTEAHIVNPWGTDEDTTPEPTQQPVKPTDDVELAFNDHGVATNVAVVSLSGRGFAVGTFVKHEGQCMSFRSCDRIKSSIPSPPS